MSMGIMFMIGMMTMIQIGDNTISSTGSLMTIIRAIMDISIMIIRTMMRMTSTIGAHIHVIIIRTITRMMSATLGITTTKMSMGIMFMIGMMTTIQIGDNIISITGSLLSIIGMMSTTIITRTMVRMISTMLGITITKMRIITN